MVAALQTPPAAGENVVLAGLARALVQPQILRLDQAVAIQRMAEQERQDGHLFIDRLRALAKKLGQDSAEKLSDMIGDVSDVEVSSDEQVAQT